MADYAPGSKEDQRVRQLLLVHAEVRKTLDRLMVAIDEEDWHHDLPENAGLVERVNVAVDLAHRTGKAERLREELHRAVRKREEKIRELLQDPSAMTGPELLELERDLQDLRGIDKIGALVERLRTMLSDVEVRPWQVGSWDFALVDEALTIALELAGTSEDDRLALRRVSSEQAARRGLGARYPVVVDLKPQAEKNRLLREAWGDAWSDLLAVLVRHFGTYVPPLSVSFGLEVKDEIKSLAAPQVTRAWSFAKCRELALEGPDEGEPIADWDERVRAALEAHQSRFGEDRQLAVVAKKIRYVQRWAEGADPEPSEGDDSAWAWRWRGLRAVWAVEPEKAADAYVRAAELSASEAEPVPIQLWTIDAALQTATMIDASRGDELASLSLRLVRLSQTHFRDVQSARSSDATVAEQKAKALSVVARKHRNPSLTNYSSPGISGRLRELGELEGLHPATVAPWAGAEAWQRLSYGDFVDAFAVAFGQGLRETVRELTDELMSARIGRHGLQLIDSWLVRPRHGVDFLIRAGAIQSFAAMLPDEQLVEAGAWARETIPRCQVDRPGQEDVDAVGKLVAAWVVKERGRVGELGKQLGGSAFQPFAWPIGRAVLERLPPDWSLQSPTNADRDVVVDLFVRQLGGNDILGGEVPVFRGFRALLALGHDPWSHHAEPLRAWATRARLWNRARLFALSPTTRTELESERLAWIDALVNEEGDAETRVAHARALVATNRECANGLATLAPALAHLQLDPGLLAALVADCAEVGHLDVHEADRQLVAAFERDIRSASALSRVSEPPPGARTLIERATWLGGASSVERSRYGTSPEMGVLHSLCCEDGAWVPSKALEVIATGVRLGDFREARLGLSALGGLLRREVLDPTSRQDALALVRRSQRDLRMPVLTAADELASRFGDGVATEEATNGR